MIIKIFQFKVLVILLTLFALSGCGAKGAKFSGFQKPVEGKGLIYLYRPESFNGGSVYYDVHAQGKVIGTLRNGGYFLAYLEPGETEIWAKTKAKNAVYIDIKPNTMYCVKGGVDVGLMMGRPTLVTVNQMTCKHEILETQFSSD